MAEQNDSFLRVKTIAEIANVSQRTVEKWIAERRLRAVRFGAGSIRIPREAWAEFVEKAAIKD